MDTDSTETADPALPDSLYNLSATVRGRVQNVGFRVFVLGLASELGIRGYVRNLPGGGVEVSAYGSRVALDTLLARLREGPPGARVSQVDTQWSEVAANSIPADFTVRH